MSAIAYNSGLNVPGPASLLIDELSLAANEYT